MLLGAKKDIMKTYEEIVEEARKSNSSRVITNNAPSHAKILIKSLLTSARKNSENVKIISGAFYKGVYDDDVANDFEETLKDGVIFDVIISDADENDLAENPVYNVLKKNGARVRLAKGVFEHIPHFVLVGSSRYRLEADPSKISAIASFNDSDTGEAIDGLFQMASDTVDLQ